MKGKRMRNAQKTLLFYKLHYNVVPPYRLLIDGTVCNTAYENHINLAEQIPKLFQAEVKICTTRCALTEVEGLQARFGVSRGTALSILKQFPVIPCHHDLPGDVTDCFSSKFKNNSNIYSDRNKYCVGSQDDCLRKKAREDGGVPIFILKSKVPHIEPPSAESRQRARELTESRKISEHSKEVLAGIKRSRDISDDTKPDKKKRKTKGKNPNSCLKKKKKVLPQSLDGKKSRKRRHKKSVSGEDIVSLIKDVVGND